MIYGVDLYHGDAMLDVGQYDFVFHKATQGAWFIDPACQERMATVRAAGKLAGMYHFMTTDEPIKAQVDFFLATAQPRRSDVLVLDFENDGKWANIANLDLAAMATSFMNELQLSAEFHRVLIYCNRNNYDNIVKPFGVPLGDGLWVAESLSEPQLGQLFWQYNSDVVDHDKGYFPSLQTARQWADELTQIPPGPAQQSMLLED